MDHAPAPSGSQPEACRYDTRRRFGRHTSRLPSFSFRPGLAPIRTDSLPDRGTWG
jgi:hypothetical protein